MNNKPTEAPVHETTNEARQGPLGRPILLVLIGGLILAFLAWGAAEFYGESSDDAATVQKSDQTAPLKTTGDQPGTTTPVQQDQAPQTGTGGDSQMNSTKP